MRSGSGSGERERHPLSFSEGVGRMRNWSVMARAITAVGKTNRLKWDFALLVNGF